MHNAMIIISYIIFNSFSIITYSHHIAINHIAIDGIMIELSLTNRLDIVGTIGKMNVFIIKAKKAIITHVSIIHS